MKAKTQRVALVWLIVTQVLMALSVVAWAALLVRYWPLYLLAFNGRSSAQGYGIIAAVLCYPLLPLVFGAVSWLCYALRREVAALILTTVPLVVLLVAWWLRFGR